MRILRIRYKSNLQKSLKDLSNKLEDVDKKVEENKEAIKK